MFDKIYLAIIAATVIIIISLSVYNRSIKSELQKSILTTEKVKAELGGKYNALNKKYEALKNRPEPPVTCEERLNQINVNQERFLE